jgi:hypothetical protein
VPKYKKINKKYIILLINIPRKQLNLEVYVFLRGSDEKKNNYNNIFFFKDKRHQPKLVFYQ